MKKLTKQSRKTLFNFLLIFGTIFLVIYFSTQNGDIDDAWLALRSSNPFWICAAVFCWLVFVVFESLVFHVFFRFQKVKVHFSTSLLVTILGMFYSSITPGASGGQPMQVFAMKKRGVSPGITTSCLAVKFFCFQMALLTIGTVLWIRFPGGVGRFSVLSKGFIYTGYALNILAVAGVLLLAINKNIVRFLIMLVLKLLKMLHIIKDLPSAMAKADSSIQDFHASVYMLTNHPFQLLILLILSGFQVLGLMSIIYCVYHAMGMGSVSYEHILALQLFLYIGASFTPLPGSSGAQEGGFYLLFDGVFPHDKWLGAMLLWRFFTYYMAMLVGMLSVIIDSARTIRGKVRPVFVSQAHADAPVSDDQRKEADI